MKLRLTLDGTKHIYNPKYRTFHITLQHLYGVQAHVNELHQMGGLSVELRNRDTGNVVEFERVGRGPTCNLYTAIYKKKTYYLMIWADTETLRTRYTADLDLYGMECINPELDLSPEFPPIPAL